MNTYVEGWQVTTWIVVGSLSVTAALSVGLALGRMWGLQVAPTVWRERSRRVAWRMSLVVVRWRERWRAEVKARESVEERHARLRGALRVYEEETA